MISKQGKERARLLAVEFVRVEREKNAREFKESLNNIKKGVKVLSSSFEGVFNKIAKDVTKIVSSFRRSY